ncbi:EAL domain, c-di-GMP-specific phosphodiesterase class I (or its enzymatically inactive variant) [Devosia crocina]|uniref:EAL domain, c-di-GMP-specific phosphodiesterase class I (Or its enzymatically inactive variant) n=1 Tax=Devosia crocina TaxID=429728 RepID=A0A1I7NBA1_9HYPH|nr:EAL domain-containing protein [Devosia crocina]SFV31945.1 EAL domain, c-di-GMP-specific phosphodiesterase class I (or its enzymatically inactive variant) [Devosia crocina]
MKAKFSHLLMLLGTLLAFVPIISVDYLLDGYARTKELARLQATADELGLRINGYTTDAVQTLRKVIADSPSFCTPTFTGIALQAIENSVNVKQVLVENMDGVQYCDAFGRGVQQSPLSESLPVPGLTETISIVAFAEMGTPAVKVSQVLGGTRRVSAFVPIIASSMKTWEASLAPGGMVDVALTSGLTVLSIGSAVDMQRAVNSTDYLVVESFAGELPIKVRYVVPFSVARANYADLDVIFTILACFVSAGLLLLALRYARRSRVPSFDLERAIGRNEIKPYYQPVINLRTGGLVGCEVLCRWEKPNGEIVPPGVFIDYAEASGMAIPMTLSLMQQVRYDLSELSQKMPGLKISINLFEGHFRDVGIVEDVQAIFGNSPISYDQLVFEITERRPLESSPAVNSVISGLHALGSKIAMDDAGTGHSNLAYIATLGVDVIKIDRIFVDMIKPGTNQVPVLDGLIAMSKDLGCEIVAEGVETEAQAVYLRAHGVTQAQGYIFAPALKIGAFRELALALASTPDESAGAGSDGGFNDAA